jgi:hypothetical protein
VKKEFGISPLPPSLPLDRAVVDPWLLFIVGPLKLCLMLVQVILAIQFRINYNSLKDPTEIVSHDIKE